MSKRYRYAFTKKKEAPGGIASVICAAVSLGAFIVAVAVRSLSEGAPGWLVGGICLTGALLSVYGFGAGIRSFSDRTKGHAASMTGSLASGVVMIIWLGLYLGGRF